VLGSYVAETGSTDSEQLGAQGICTTFTPTSSNDYLSFYVYEGGTAYAFRSADQEADIVTGSATGIGQGVAGAQTLFAEENCFYDANQAGWGETAYASSCAPLGDDGVTTATPTPSPYQDYQGGFWTTRGPYNLSAYIDTPITLFVGVWDYEGGAGPYDGSYGNFMYVGNVAVGSSSTCCEAVPSSVNRRSVQPAQAIKRR
jgi:hypothetical protein